MKKLLVFIGLLFILALTACTPSTQVEECGINQTCSNMTTSTMKDTNMTMDDNMSEIVDVVEEVDMESDEPEVELAPIEETKKVSQTYQEGDLIQLNIRAEDEDGDTLSYTYSEPFDENGEWQSQSGDAGMYDVTIVASDGKLDTSLTITIELTSVNKKPVISNFDSISVIEGQRVTFEPTVTDEDEDELTLTYSGWLSTNTYTTTFEDAGEYEVTLTASDGKESVSETVSVTVQNVNRRPIVESVADITVLEGESIEVEVNAADPDGDYLEYEFSKPLSEDGKWETQVGDADKYSVTVTVSDGEIQTPETFTVEVLSLNSAPVIQDFIDVFVSEGETITFSPTVTDEDGDNVSITYSGWMDSESYTTTFDDAGEYEVTITADDGQAQAFQTVTVVVANVNRAPVFVFE
jgi:VCBS repeat-containing protein